jgi:integrase
MALKAFQIETNANGALAMALQKAQVFADAAQAEGTKRVYAGAFRQWQEWCASMHIDPIAGSHEAMAAWIASLAHAGKSTSRINVCLAAVLHAHAQRGRDLDARHPLIRAVTAGIARRASRPIKRARPLEIGHLREIIRAITGQDLRALRDRALLLIAFWAALRRSEAVQLDLTGKSPLKITPEGLVLHLTGTKGQPKTQQIFVPRTGDDICPVAAVERYVETASIKEGPLFRAITKVGNLVQRRLDSASVTHILKSRLGTRAAEFSAHTLRAGFITSAARAGVPEHAIARTSRHRSTSALRAYIRPANGFEESAAASMMPSQIDTVDFHLYNTR